MVLPQTKLRMITKTYFKTKDYCKVKFVFNETAESVAVLGLNNDWTAAVYLSKKKDGSFAADVNLPKNSEHEFKYLVNDELWQNDPEADKEVSNIYGSTNSVLVV